MKRPAENFQSFQDDLMGLKFCAYVGPILYFQFPLIDMIPCRPHKGVRMELTWMEFVDEPAPFMSYQKTNIRFRVWYVHFWVKCSQSRFFSIIKFPFSRKKASNLNVLNHWIGEITWKQPSKLIRVIPITKLRQKLHKKLPWWDEVRWQWWWCRFIESLKSKSWFIESF